MTTLTQLIEHYCPDGVEYVKLGDVIELNPGTRITKARNTGTMFPVYGGGGVSFYTDDSNRSDEWVISRFAMSPHCFRYVSGKFWLLDSGITFAVRGEQSKQYIAHFLSSIQPLIYATSSKSAQRNLRIKDFLKLEIPLPPREVQDAIVERLDAFAALIESLDSEIVLREKRFEYFREQLLSFDELDGVEYVKLGDVAEYSSLRVDSDDLNADTFVGVDNLLKDRGGKALSEHGPNTKRSTKYQVGDVLIGNIRPYLRKIWHATNEGGCSGDVLAIHPSKVDSRFLYWTLFGDEFWHYNNNFSRGGKMPRGDKAAILAYQFPLPTSEFQQDIAGKLDTMQALIDNLKQERELRKAQFEYYREKLLTFNS